MSLRLATFNVWGLPETFGFGDDVSSRMRLIAERLSRSDLDVLMIQEAWTEEVRDTLRAGALAAGFEVADGPDGSGGLMTFSRLPIEDVRFERFRFRGDPERIAQGEFLGGKGFQTVTIETPNGPLPLVNTHLHARYRRARPELNSAVRTAQILQIVGAMHEIEGTAIVGGDFNCSLGDVEYAIFRGLAGVTELGGGGNHPTLSRTNWYKRHRTGQDKRIDFLFVRPEKGLTWAVEDARLAFAEPARIREIDRSLSDHFGFRATLHLGHQTSTAIHAPSRMPGVGRAASGTAPDPQALRLARGLLDVGREEAARREWVHSQLAFGWAGAALVATGVRQVPSVDRRRFLRGVAGATGVAALAPALGFGALARLDSDHKRDAFDDAHAVLVRLETLRDRRTV